MLLHQLLQTVEPELLGQSRYPVPTWLEGPMGRATYDLWRGRLLSQSLQHMAAGEREIAEASVCCGVIICRRAQIIMYSGFTTN